MDFGVIENAGDGRQRIVGGVALTHDSASDRAPFAESVFPVPPGIFSSLPNEAEFCPFRRKTAVTGVLQGRFTRGQPRKSE